jgi:hypothetical protein
MRWMIEILETQRCWHIHVVEGCDQVLSSLQDGNKEDNVPRYTVYADANTIGVLSRWPHRPNS